MDLLTFAITGLNIGEYGNGNADFSEDNIVIISKKQDIPEQVQSDFGSTDGTSPEFIKNKPGLVSDTEKGFMPPVNSGFSINLISPTEGQEFAEGDPITFEVGIVEGGGKDKIAINGDWQDSPYKAIEVVTQAEFDALGDTSNDPTIYMIEDEG